MVVANNEIDSDKKYTSNAGNFDDHAGTAVRCGAHRPTQKSWTISGPETDPLLKSLLQKAAYKYETPLFELKS